MVNAVAALADRRKKRFAEFSSEPPPLEGDKIQIDNILNREIEIIGHRIAGTRYSKNTSGKYLTLQIRFDDQLHIVFTGSDVLVRQLTEYASEIPFFATIKKINRYYTLT
jgi:hypothetical protein